jgi:hypothetical protein
MKKQILAMTMAVLASGGIFGIEVISADVQPSGCTRLAEIRAGNLFNRHTKDIAFQSVVEDAKSLGAQKVSVEMIRHAHPKLGNGYSARGVAYSCGN